MTSYTDFCEQVDEFLKTIEDETNSKWETGSPPNTWTLPCMASELANRANGDKIPAVDEYYRQCAALEQSDLPSLDAELYSELSRAVKYMHTGWGWLQADTSTFEHDDKQGYHQLEIELFPHVLTGPGRRDFDEDVIGWDNGLDWTLPSLLDHLVGRAKCDRTGEIEVTEGIYFGSPARILITTDLNYQIDTAMITAALQRVFGRGRLDRVVHSAIKRAESASRRR